MITQFSILLRCDLTINLSFPVFFSSLINRAGGLCERILTKVVSTVRTQRGLYTRTRSDFPIQTDLARLIRCLLYGTGELNWFKVTGLY